jgi:hypothetical protein
MEWIVVVAAIIVFGGMFYSVYDFITHTNHH